MMHHRRTLLTVPQLRGFTLIELMIVVVIVAILAAVAYPSYRKSVLKGRRADATISLTKLAQRLERCHTQFGSYDNTGCSVRATTPTAPLASDDGYYNIAVSFNSTVGFKLTATATGTQTDDVCDNFTLDGTGARGATDPEVSNAAAARDACW